jgi:vacuolar-type H+-ATPase subunit D/Vma8
MTNTLQQDISLLNINLSNARSENESYEDYRNRLKTNKAILKTYFTMGRDAFREMFPNGVADAMQEAANKANQVDTHEVEVPMETVPTNKKKWDGKIGGSLHLSE